MPKKTAKVHHDEGHAHPTKDVVPEEASKPKKEPKKHHAKDQSTEKKIKHKHKHKKHKHHEHGSSKSKHPHPTKNKDQAVKVEHKDMQPPFDKHREQTSDDVNVSLEEVSENFDQELEASFARFDQAMEHLQANFSASGMNVDEATSDEVKEESEEPTNTEHTEQDPLTKLRQLYHNKVIEMNDRRVDEVESGLSVPHFPFERILKDITWIGQLRNKKKEKSSKLLLKIDFLSNGAIEGTIGVKNSEEVASLEGYWRVPNPQDHPEAVDIVWLQTQDNSAVLVDGTLTVKEYKKDVVFDGSIKGTYKEYDGNKKHNGTLCFKSNEAKAKAPVETNATRRWTTEFDLEAQTDPPIAIAVPEPAQKGKKTTVHGQATSHDATECIIQPTLAQRAAQENQNGVTKRRCAIGTGVIMTIGLVRLLILLIAWS